MNRPVCTTKSYKVWNTEVVLLKLHSAQAKSGIQSLKSGDLNQTTEVDLSHIYKGIYFLKASGRKGVACKKLVIQ